jgi:hypothetical protein
MLSTSDNPFNPWTEWDQWFQWDTQEMYNSLALLDRVVRSSDELSEQLQEQAYDDAVDTIVTENVSGVHIKVAKPTNIS